MAGLSSNTGFFKTKGFYIYSPYAPVPMNETNLTGLGLSSASIDERLIYLSEIDPPLTDITIYLFGNDDRTSASDAAVAILTNNGCYLESD